MNRDDFDAMWYGPDESDGRPLTRPERVALVGLVAAGLVPWVVLVAWAWSRVTS